VAVVKGAEDLLELLGQIGRGFPQPGWREMMRAAADGREQNRRIVKPSLAAKRCATCHVAEVELEEGKSLRKCARCQLVWYCSADCQKSDWHAGHKRLCRVHDA